MVNEYLTKSDIIDCIDDQAKNNKTPTNEAIDAFEKDLEVKLID